MTLPIHAVTEIAEHTLRKYNLHITHFANHVFYLAHTLILSNARVPYQVSFKFLSLKRLWAFATRLFSGLFKCSHKVNTFDFAVSAKKTPSLGNYSISQ